MIFFPFLNFVLNIFQHLFQMLNYFCLKRAADNMPPLPPPHGIFKLVRVMYDLLKTMSRKKKRYKTKPHKLLRLLRGYR